MVHLYQWPQHQPPQLNLICYALCQTSTFCFLEKICTHKHGQQVRGKEGRKEGEETKEGGEPNIPGPKHQFEVTQAEQNNMCRHEDKSPSSKYRDNIIVMCHLEKERNTKQRLGHVIAATGMHAKEIRIVLLCAFWQWREKTLISTVSLRQQPALQLKSH